MGAEYHGSMYQSGQLPSKKYRALPWYLNTVVNVTNLKNCYREEPYFLGAPICNTVLQHFSCNMVDATRTTPQETLFLSLVVFGCVWYRLRCCQLVCFELGVLHFRLPLYTRNGQVGEHVLLLWFLALVLAGCCCQLVCFEFVVLHFRLPIPETGRL